jgi:hypothetical protein
MQGGGSAVRQEVDLRLEGLPDVLPDDCHGQHQVLAQVGHRKVHGAQGRLGVYERRAQLLR